MTEEKALAVRESMSLADTMTLGEVMAKSGFFADAKTAAQAVVKILAGREIGVGAFASMVGVSIIQGKPAIGANLLAAKVKDSGRYDYRLLRLDNDGCEIEFTERGKVLGRSVFTKEDAQRAGLAGKDNWNKYPKAMYFARAMSQGVRWYCPNVTTMPIYTPDELGALVDGDGDVVDVIPTPVPPAEANGKAHEPMTPGRLLSAVNDKTGGYYNAAPHLRNAIAVEADDKEWDWPHPDDRPAWLKAYNLALSHTKRHTAPEPEPQAEQAAA